MEPFYRAKLSLEKIEPFIDKYDNVAEKRAELAAFNVTGDTPADAMVQLCAHADSLHDWHLVQAGDDADPADLLYEAWALIANAGWDAHRGLVDLEKTDGWHEAALKWRDRYHASLGAVPADVPDEEFHADPQQPTIVVLCGSTRFGHAFQEANLRETLAGRIVLSIGCDMRSDGELFAHLDDAGLAKVKTDLDALHLRKIDLADEVLVLNVGGYVGESTKSEIDYAISHGKVVRWLEPGTEDTPEAIAERLGDPAKCTECGLPGGADHTKCWGLRYGTTGMVRPEGAERLGGPGSIRQADGTDDEPLVFGPPNRCGTCSDVIEREGGRWVHRTGPHDHVAAPATPCTDPWSEGKASADEYRPVAP